VSAPWCWEQRREVSRFFFESIFLIFGWVGVGVFYSFGSVVTGSFFSGGVFPCSTHSTPLSPPSLWWGRRGLFFLFRPRRWLFSSQALFQRGRVPHWLGYLAFFLLGSGGNQFGLDVEG